MMAFNQQASTSLRNRHTLLSVGCSGRPGSRLARSESPLACTVCAALHRCIRAEQSMAPILRSGPTTFCVLVNAAKSRSLRSIATGDQQGHRHQVPHRPARGQVDTAALGEA